MSKWVNAGTILGAVSGAVSAAIAVWQFAQPGPIDDTDGVIAALNGIRDAIQSGTVDLSAADQRQDIVDAALPVSALLARNLNVATSDEVALLGNIADALPGETVEFPLPGGSTTRVTFLQWNNQPPNVVLVYEGERVVTAAGWQAAVGDTGCIIVNTGPTRDEVPMARFRLDCPA